MAFNPQVVDKPKYDLPEEGLYPARLARIIEIGEQNTPYGIKPQVVLGFTIPSLTVKVGEEDKQQMMWTFPINVTSNPDGKLMKYVKALKADSTHLNQMLSRGCMLEITHTDPKPDGTQYANIANITKPMAGLDIPEPDIEVFMYEFDEGEGGNFDKIGEYRQKQVKSATNFGQ